MTFAIITQKAIFAYHYTPSKLYHLTNNIQVFFVKVTLLSNSIFFQGHHREKYIYILSFYLATIICLFTAKLLVSYDFYLLSCQASMDHPRHTALQALFENLCLKMEH